MWPVILGGTWSLISGGMWPLISRGIQTVISWGMWPVMLYHKWCDLKYLVCWSTPVYCLFVFVLALFHPPNPDNLLCGSFSYKTLKYNKASLTHFYMNLIFCYTACCVPGTIRTENQFCTVNIKLIRNYIHSKSSGRVNGGRLCW